MPYERFQVKRLGEHIRSHLIGGYQDQLHLTSALQLPHLENLAFDVTRVLTGSGAVAQVVGPFVVDANLHGFVLEIADALVCQHCES